MICSNIVCVPSLHCLAGDEAPAACSCRRSAFAPRRRGVVSCYIYIDIDIDIDIYICRYRYIYIYTHTHTHTHTHTPSRGGVVICFNISCIPLLHTGHSVFTPSRGGVVICFNILCIPLLQPSHQAGECRNMF